MPTLKYDIVPYWFNTSTPRGANSEIEIHFHLFPYTDSFLRRKGDKTGNFKERERGKLENRRCFQFPLPRLYSVNSLLPKLYSLISPSPGSTRLISLSLGSTRLSSPSSYFYLLNSHSSPGFAHFISNIKEASAEERVIMIKPVVEASMWPAYTFSI